MKKKQKGKQNSQKSIPAKISDPKWIPWATVVLIVAMYLISLANKGALTWAFNAIVYGPYSWGFFFTLFCVSLVFLAAKYQDLITRKIQNRNIQYLFLAFLLAGFVYMLLANQPLYPTLEGDGNLNPPGRLRNLIVNTIFKIVSTDETTAAAISWRLVGIVYITFFTIFIFSITKEFWERFWGLAYFSLFPGVLNFCGYIDSYAVFYTCVSIFLGSLYLVVKRHLPYFLIPSIIFLGLSTWEHKFFELGLLFPALWILLFWLKNKEISLTIRNIIIVLTILFTSIPGFWIKRNTGDFGILFSHVLHYDGLIAALYHPLILMLSFLLPYVFFVILFVSTRPKHLWFFENFELGAAFYGTLAIFLAYYLLQLFTPIAIFGIGDFFCQAGCLGGIFVVPLFVMGMETPIKKYFYCIVILCLFLTIPNIVLHRHPDVANRIINVVDGERSEYYDVTSPHVHFGSKFIDIAKSQDMKLRFIAYKIFEKGIHNHGFYEHFIPKNYYFLIRWQYEMGDFDLGKKNMETFLRTMPGKFEGLLGPGAGPAIKVYTKNSLVRLGDMETLANKLLQETGNPIYTRIETACEQNLYIAQNIMTSENTGIR